MWSILTPSVRPTARVRSRRDVRLALLAEVVGDRRLKMLEDATARGAAFGAGKIVSFDFEPMLGMKIMTVSKVGMWAVDIGVDAGCLGCRVVL